MSIAQSAAVPPGFVPVAMGGPFVGANGPLYVWRQGQQTKVGLRIEQKHCNALGTCHGGLLATFADQMMPVAMYAHLEGAGLPRFLPTVSLQLDFIGPVYLDDWIEGETQVLRATRSLVFAQGLVQVAGEPVLRASGVYKIAAEIGDSPGMYTDEMPAVPPRRRASQSSR